MFYVYVLPSFMYAHHMCAVLSEVRRGHQIPWYWSYRCWGLNSQCSLTTEPSLHPLVAHSYVIF